MKAKRNDQCPCGSGKKVKNCCLLKEGGKPRSSPTKPKEEPKQLDPETMSARNFIESGLALLQEAGKEEEKGQFRRAVDCSRDAIRCFVMCVKGGGHRDMMPHALTALCQCIEHLRNAGDFDRSLEMGERALRILEPPHRFHPYRTLDLDSKDWKEETSDDMQFSGEMLQLILTNEGEGTESGTSYLDMGICIPASVHGEMGMTHSKRLNAVAALKCYERSLAALRRCKPSAARHHAESNVLMNMGNQYLVQCQRETAAEFYKKARAAGEAATAAGKAASGAPGREGRIARMMVEAAASSFETLRLNSALLANDTGPQSNEREVAGLLSELEALWAGQQKSNGSGGGGDGDGGGSSTVGEMSDSDLQSLCRNAITAGRTRAQQEPWIRRFMMLRAASKEIRGSTKQTLAGASLAASECRHCHAPGGGATGAAGAAEEDDEATGGAAGAGEQSPGAKRSGAGRGKENNSSPAPAAAAGGKKLKLCMQCRTVAYCGRNCQAADWGRHKAACKAVGAAGACGSVDADALLSESLCRACSRSMLEANGGLIHALACGHCFHASCTEELRLEVEGPSVPGCKTEALCPTCARPFSVKCSPYTFRADGTPEFMDREAMFAAEESAKARGEHLDLRGTFPGMISLFSADGGATGMGDGAKWVPPRMPGGTPFAFGGMAGGAAARGGGGSGSSRRR